MDFYVGKYGFMSGNEEVNYPCVALYTDPWDDLFEAETLFHASYHTKTKVTKLGDVKIMTTKGTITRVHIDDHFSTLDESFCSLGQSLDYYKAISEFPQSTQSDILRGLKDAAINKEVSEKFKEKRIFNISLLRFSEAEKAYKEATKYFGSNISKLLQFEFNIQLEGATAPHKVKFNFSEDELPYRINAFVGKNATGKTKVLTELAAFLSGTRLDLINSPFVPERPSFSKVITISYSAFDELYKPFEDEDLKIREKGSELFSYKYCGLRSKEGILSLSDLEREFFSSYREIKDKGRYNEWKSIIKNVFEEEHINLIDSIENSLIEANLTSYLSSGQNILLSTITDVVANIEDDSLLLFDEPELHLHPNAIANFMRLFYELLNRFNSYAIISTHSPIIIQEIPSKYVRVFSRIDNVPIVENPLLQCFGENISNITNEIFNVKEYESNYKVSLKQLAKTRTKDEIISLFNDELSFNALTYLNSMYKSGGLS